jgi:hypothetical protein
MIGENIKESDIHISINLNDEAKVEGTIYCDSFLMDMEAIDLCRFNAHAKHTIMLIAENNGITFNPDTDKCVYLYHVTNFCDDLGDNFTGGHNLKYKDKNEDTLCDIPVYIKCLPASMFQGKKEGDIVEFDYNGYMQIPLNELNSIEVKLHFILRLAQMEYKNKHLGRFEDALENVLIPRSRGLVHPIII